MSAPTAAPRDARTHRVSRYLGRIGWAYVVYCVLMVAVLVGLAIYDLGLGYLGRIGLAEALTFLMYPPFVPGLVACGGMHDRCTTLLGRGVQILAFLAGVAWYLVGWWVLATCAMSRIRQRRHARAEDA